MNSSVDVVHHDSPNREAIIIKEEPSPPAFKESSANIMAVSGNNNAAGNPNHSKP